MYTCVYTIECVYGRVCEPEYKHVCTSVCVRVHACVHAHVQGPFRFFQCEQTSRNSGHYFLQFLPSPSKQTNKIIPTSIYGASNTRAPPHQHLEKLRTGQFRALWKNEGSGGRRDVSHGNDCFAKTLSLL